MEIQILIDEEDNDELSTDLVGEIRLSDGQNMITESITYIDSWLDALEEGRKQLSQSSKVYVDLIEETKPLVFENEGKDIKISYGDMYVYVKNREEIDFAIQKTLKEVNHAANKSLDVRAKQRLC